MDFSTSSPHKKVSRTHTFFNLKSPQQQPSPPAPPPSQRAAESALWRALSQIHHPKVEKALFQRSSSSSTASPVDPPPPLFKTKKGKPLMATLSFEGQIMVSTPLFLDCSLLNVEEPFDLPVEFVITICIIFPVVSPSKKWGHSVFYFYFCYCILVSCFLWFLVSSCWLLLQILWRRVTSLFEHFLLEGEKKTVHLDRENKTLDGGIRLSLILVEDMVLSQLDTSPFGDLEPLLDVVPCNRQDSDLHSGACCSSSDCDKFCASIFESF